MSKRTLDSFFSPPSKRNKVHDSKVSEKEFHLDDKPLPVPENHKTEPDINGDEAENASYTTHATYAFPIANLPSKLAQPLEDLLITASGKPINDQPHLDLLYFQPLIQQPTASELFHHLRSSLPFYRVKYTITRFGKSLDINTPRFTTVFGLDETSRFSTTSKSSLNPSVTHLETQVVEASNNSIQVAPGKYKCVPRPIPPSLSLLLNVTEAITGDTFNFCLVNYYANGNDSISYHSDDERFLGHNPSIASFTLGAKRDFLMKHKPPEKGQPEVDSKPLKLSLGSGDMVLMRGETQSNWLHSIPKRKGGDADKGRINITLRKAMVPGGTENYYRYNVGDGEVYRWNDKRKEMVPIEPVKTSNK